MITSVEVTRNSPHGGWVVIVTENQGDPGRRIVQVDFTAVMAEAARYTLAMLLGRDA